MSLRTISGYACIVVGGVAFLGAVATLIDRSLAAPVDADAMLALGEERLAGGDIEGAREWFSKAAKAAPESATKARVAEARLAEVQGDLASAIESYRAATEDAPEALEPALQLTRALRRASRISEARAELERAREHHPRAKALLWHFGALELDAGDLDAAAEIYREMEQLFPTSAEGALGLGAIEESRGDVALAAEAYERASRADGESVPAWEGRGRLAAAAADFEAAEAAYRRVVELRPDDGTALSVLATLVERQGRFSDSVALFRRALSLLAGEEGARESRALAWTGLGTSLLAMDRSDEAYRALASALTEDPDQPEALWALVPIYLEREEFEAASSALERVIPTRADEPMLWVLVGRAEGGLGRWDEARTALLHALELDGSHLEAKLWLGIALRVLGVYRSALLTLEEVVSERPDDGLAQLNLAISHGQLGETASARRCFAEARRLLPTSPLPLYHEAHMLLGLGDGPAALELARRAVALDSSNSGALEVLARALQSAGEQEAAQRRAVEALGHARDDAQRQYLRRLVEELGGDAS